MTLPRQAIIYFFSGCGSTWYVAQIYADLLKHHGLTCQLVPIELGIPDDRPLPEDVLVGIAMPVYGGGLPRGAKLWLEHLPPGEGRPAFVFATGRQQQGSALIELTRRMTERGYSVLYETLYFLDATTYDASDTAANWLRTDIVEDITSMINNKRRLVLQVEMLYAPARLVHACYLLACRFAPRLLRIDDTCNQCLVCLRLCPVSAISLDRAQDAREDQKLHITIHRNCILCMRCAALCPQHAISSAWPRLLPVPTTEPGFIEMLDAAHMAYTVDAGFGDDAKKNGNKDLL